MPHRRPLLLTGILLAAAACGDSGTEGPMEPEEPTNAPPVAAFVVEVTGSSAPVGATFNAGPSADSDGEIVSWEWSFGDATTATGERVEHVFDRAGSFQVLLTVTDNEGATNTSVQVVEVEEPAADEIAGLVWFDADGDGARGDDETGLPGMVVFLDDDGDGELDGEETATTSSLGGVYHFDGLAPGTYRVTQELSLGWTNTAPGPDAAGAVGEWHPGPARILGGDDAPAGEYPFMASVQIAAEEDRQAAHICGGSLIAPQWVLTASHCLSDSFGEPFPADFLEILLGTNLLDGESGERVEIEATFLNPGYSPAGGFYKRDISLVKLTRRFEDTPRVFLTDSATFLENVEPTDRGTLIGWGRIGDSGGIPESLQIAEIPLRPDSDCEDSWNDDETVRFESSMLCVGHLGGTPDSCAGDSGGPWMFEIGGRLHQLGAVSWGPVPCGRPTIPSAYASVPAMLAFIESIVPTEPSGFVEVTLNGGSGGRADFGNFH